MKKIILVLIVTMFALNAQAQIQTDETPYLFKLGDTKFGGYVAINTKVTDIKPDIAGIADFKAAITLKGGWAVGFSASGLYYDKKLSKIVNDGTYHLYTGYAGMFVDKRFELNKNMNLTMSIFTGRGEAYYRYDKDFRKDKVYYQEYIDKTEIFITEPSVELNYRVFGNFWLGINGSYRFSSPVEMIGTDEKYFSNFNAGLTFKYGLFL